MPRGIKKAKVVEAVNYDNLPRAELIAELKARDQNAEVVVYNMLEKERGELKDAVQSLVQHVRDQVVIDGHETLGTFYVKKLAMIKGARKFLPSYSTFGFDISYHAEKLREALKR